MASRLFIVFTDFDGVMARVQTWGNDTLFAGACAKIGCPEMRDLDIYALNRLDRLCRGLGKDDAVWLVSTSMWKRVFMAAKNRKFITKWAGLKKMEIVHKNRKSFDRFTPCEPYTRIRLIQWYLKKYSPDGFVIFDDNYEYDLRKAFGREHFIHTDKANGLTFDDYVAFRGIVSSWAPVDVSEERLKAFDVLMASIC